MLNELLNETTIQIVNDTSKLKGWRDAITLAAEPLVRENVIHSTYIDSMIKNVEESGPYINIGPKIALAHAKSNNDVNRIGISLLKTFQDVNLVDGNHPVQLWFVLAAPDNTSHLKLLQDLTQLLMDKNSLDKLNKAQSVQEILDVIESINRSEIKN